jgi:polyhydroxybutyrate depolymerase
MSNGGFMSYFLSCSIADRFAAMASVTGTHTETGLALCYPSTTMPVLQIHGTDDFVVPYNGSNGIVSVDELMEFWRSHNNCDATPDTIPVPDIVTSDFCTAEIIEWHNCDNSRVMLYRVIDGGHTWPGASIPIGVTNQDFHASVAIWNFFNQFPATTSMEELPLQPFSVYPNPASRSATLQFPFLIHHLEMMSLTGEIIFSQTGLNTNQMVLQLGNIPAGIYFTRVWSEAGTVYTTKLLVN